ncbi:MAG: Bax inhibitor-1/YccA family protein [Spirochaetia bacterium]|nr:Bax inhibitor-1/YccA family protein [Spirochaetia bacterium]
MDMTREAMLSRPMVRERNILRNVYLWMTGGLTLTGILAYLTASSPQVLNLIFGTPGVLLVLILAEFALVIYISARMDKISAQSAVFAFIAYAGINGIVLSSIFLAYSSLVISRAFFTTAAAFAGMSLYGMTTKRSLAGMGQYLFMALWGVLIASVINMFIGSSSVYYLISYAAVLVFLGLTAWDTQVIRGWNDAYGSTMDEQTYVKLSILGALRLYLDFINIFLYLLRIFGRRN